MRIDAHQHFWQYDTERGSWITDDMQVIRRDFMPEDLEPILSVQQMDGCVAVQADQSERENDFLLGLASSNPWIKGVVGWVDLMGEQLEGRLEYYKAFDRFVGVRHVLQAEPDGFMTNVRFVAGLKALATQDLSYDILTTERQLSETLQLVRQLPEMRLVIDHISKPDIKSNSFDHWAKHMKALSEHEHVYVKLSGMVTEADWAGWSAADLEPYIDFCLEHFGANRLMYGSDWPVCLVAGSYDRVLGSLNAIISDLSHDEQEMIMGQAAVHFYKLT